MPQSQSPHAPLATAAYVSHLGRMRATQRRHDYDVAILGAGSGGFAAARTAAAAGLKTVVIEGGAEVGGLCILRGCMPSKALLYAAEVLHLARHARTWGLRVPRAGFDFAQVMARKDRMIEDFASHRRQQLANARFKFLRARARFLDPHTLTLSPVQALGEGVKRGSSRTLHARHFVIATGSTVSAPPLPQLGEVGCLTSDDMLTLKKLPRSVIVLGGGAIACELAQFLARFEVKVTMIQRSPHILREFDPDTAAAVETALRRDGIQLFTDTQLLDARRERRGKTVTFAHAGKRMRVKADEILFALGRTPNTAGLGLGDAGVKLDGARVITNECMQTSVPHIFAAGDCTGPHEIVHIAIQQGEIAAHNIARPLKPRKTDYRLLTSVVFTDPQVAIVGLTEKTAAAAGVPCLTASYPFNDHGKSLIMEALDGFVKLLANPRTGEILGGACVGPAGGELIHEITAAMAKRMTVHELAAMPHYHPTLAEIWTYPAEELAEKIPVRRR
ncbi:MAG TPA: NAD(P)/FAD-dependent oxidoreductase [Verrucomicrobiae bacterium]|nr:NAD(P)/FAD-dependent oxidoreductase [Verrucomicrobiae bacterium]